MLKTATHRGDANIITSDSLANAGLGCRGNSMKGINKAKSQKFGANDWT